MKTDITHVIGDDLLKRLASIQIESKAENLGHITTIADGVVKISGLPSVAYFELLTFPGNVMGLAINLEEDSIGAIILGPYEHLREGDEVRATNTLLSIPVSDAMVGRIVNPLGDVIDGKGLINSKIRYPIEKLAPGVTIRQAVNTPLQTGIKAIDGMIPIGRGQRELIIGDRNTGKTAIAIDTIINQKNEDVICIYVAIGQKASRVAQVVSDFEKHKAMKHTIVVAASASDEASLQFLAPYAGCALAEYFMDSGKDVLIVYDDLTKHAWAYRQISLILRRPSGREAYPGDIFYLHSRLLERACRVDTAHGGGSITALPIIETQANDLSAYIPTNVISITDGQIFLESELFNSGQRPAINVGLSVSRVGGTAQIKAMKKVAGNLRLDLAQYRSLAAFAQFSSDLDETTKKQIDRGSRMMEVLKQELFVPMNVEHQVVVMWFGANGYMDQFPVSRISSLEKEYLEFIEKQYEDIFHSIKKERLITDQIEKKLRIASDAFVKHVTQKSSKT
jgi:F-type H+/Na+-transporting ATPase subunit alpha